MKWNRSRSAVVGLAGFTLLGIGIYLPWMRHTGGTAVLIHPWEATGLHPPRAFLLVPLVAVFALRASDRLPRIRVLLGVCISVASVLGPPLRILQVDQQSGVDFAPAPGFFLTTLGGLVLAVAATLAWTERRRADPSRSTATDDRRITE